VRQEGRSELRKIERSDRNPERRGKNYVRRGSALGQAFAALRFEKGLSTAELLRRARVKEETFAGYLRGEREPQSPQMARLAGALREHPERLTDLASLLEMVSDLPKTAPLAPATVALALAWPLRNVFLDAARNAALDPAASPVNEPQSRNRIEELVDRLAELEWPDRAACVERSRGFRDPRIVTALGERSTLTAANSSEEAERWAELAWLAARLTTAPEAQRRRLLAEALAYKGNAARAGGSVHRAAKHFEQAQALRSGSTSVPDLDDSRFLSLLASFYVARRNLPESLSLLHRALATAQPESFPRILVKRAKTYEELGRNDEALADLRTADALNDPEADPRLAWIIRFNLLVNLCALDRTAEAEPLLPELRAQGERFVQGLDLLRLDWLEAKVDFGQGRRAQAIERLDRVRRAFLERRIVYDAALATLELAVFLLQEGRTQEVKEHARELGRTFRDQGVEREALASLVVYRQAAEQERLTLAALRDSIAQWMGAQTVTR
jgi:tetratricopeptide (TPR) repeat protein